MIHAGKGHLIEDQYPDFDGDQQVIYDAIGNVEALLFLVKHRPQVLRTVIARLLRLSGLGE